MQFVVNYKPISVFRMSKSNNVTRAVGSKVDWNFLYKCSDLCDMDYFLFMLFDSSIY